MRYRPGSASETGTGPLSDSEQSGGLQKHQAGQATIAKGRKRTSALNLSVSSWEHSIDDSVR